MKRMPIIIAAALVPALLATSGLAESKRVGDELQEAQEQIAKKREEARQRAIALRAQRIKQERERLAELERQRLQEEERRQKVVTLHPGAAAQPRAETERARALRVIAWLDSQEIPWRPAETMAEEFAANESEATKDYTGKEMHVVGTVSTLETEDEAEPHVVLNNSVSCRLPKEQNTDLEHIEPGKGFIIRGVCEGRSEDGLILFTHASVVGSVMK